MPNWNLAAGGDWLHYKEATTGSAWCLTCKSCRSMHTLCRGRRRRAYGHTGERASSGKTLRERLLEAVQQEAEQTISYQSGTFLRLVQCELMLLLHANPVNPPGLRKNVTISVTGVRSRHTEHQQDHLLYSPISSRIGVIAVLAVHHPCQICKLIISCKC